MSAIIPRAKRQPTVVIVGAGVSGICMAIKLKEAGINDVTVLEKAEAIGGTWRDNTYPGLTCDIPSRFYQYSFAMNPSWSRFMSPGSEILDYLNGTVDRYDVRRHVRFGQEVTCAEFVDGRWRITLADGSELAADFFISATGFLHHPRYPDIAGLDGFQGPVFHSARWDHSVPLERRRVAVIGTGSTGVQIVSALAGVASNVALFQRTAQWVVRMPNWRHTRVARAAFERVSLLNRIAYRTTRATLSAFATGWTRPGWQRALLGLVCRASLRSVRDPVLRRKLTPPDQPGCKRLVVSSSFYRAVQHPSVKVVTDAIERVEPTGIATSDGVLHEVDVIVLATGFDTHAFLRPIRLVGRGGMTLDEAWSKGPRAYRTVALPDFPNFFMLMGPHSPVGSYSIVAIAEAQADYALGWIREWQAGSFIALTPTAESTVRFNEGMRAAMPDTVWMTGCSSWYLGDDGLPEVWPWNPRAHREMLSTHDASEFHLEPLPTASTADDTTPTVDVRAGS